jgi:hypothetical protein
MGLVVDLASTNKSQESRKSRLQLRLRKRESIYLSQNSILLPLPKMPPPFRRKPLPDFREVMSAISLAEMCPPECSSLARSTAEYCGVGGNGSHRQPTAKRGRYTSVFIGMDLDVYLDQLLHLGGGGGDIDHAHPQHKDTV